MVGTRTQPGRLHKVLKSVLSTARRRLRKLKAQRLARTFSEPPDPESEFTVPYHGWGITDKAYQTEEYKKACEAEEKILQEAFGSIRSQSNGQIYDLGGVECESENETIFTAPI